MITQLFTKIRFYVGRSWLTEEDKFHRGYAQLQNHASSDMPAYLYSYHLDK